MCKVNTMNTNKPNAHSSGNPVVGEYSTKKRKELIEQWKIAQNTQREKSLATRDKIRHESGMDFEGPSYSHVSYVNNILSTARTIDGHSVESLFKNIKVVGENVKSNFLEGLFLGKDVEKIGNNFEANNLSWISIPGDFLTKKEYLYKASRFKSIGNNVRLGSLQSLVLTNHSSFEEIGENFYAPNMIDLNLSGNNKVKNLPKRVYLPSLATINLTGRKELKELPEPFLQSSQIRSIELLGSGIRYSTLPQYIRENAQKIYIDIRPLYDQYLNIGGTQSTHRTIIHKDSSASAQRIMNRLPKFHERKSLSFTKNRGNRSDMRGNLDKSDFDIALEELRKFVFDQAQPCPSDLVDIIKSSNFSFEKLIPYIQGLPKNHPHQLYYTSEINAAARLLDDPVKMDNLLHHVDEKSGVDVLTYILACWKVAKNESLRRQDFKNLKGKYVANPLSTVQDSFIRMLFDICRGHNHTDPNSVDVDDCDPRDKMLCGGGSFNKVSEVMSSSLIDCEIRYWDNSTKNAKAKSKVLDAARKIIYDRFDRTLFFRQNDDGTITFAENKETDKLKNKISQDLLEEFTSVDDPQKLKDQNFSVMNAYVEAYMDTMDLSDIINSIDKKGKGKAM